MYKNKLYLNFPHSTLPCFLDQQLVLNSQTNIKIKTKFVVYAAQGHILVCNNSQWFLSEVHKIKHPSGLRIMLSHIYISLY